jgi:hypothetical protein
VPGPADELIRPAVVLCPPLAPDGPSPAWHEDLARHLAALDIPTVRPAVGRAPGSPASAPAPPGDPASAEPGIDRMAIAAWVADQAVAITAAGLDRPLILVAAGPATVGLPALGFSQRASRRTVVTYVMVDGPLPQVGPATGDWPDAPVLCLRHAGSPELDEAVAAGARLRGWPVRREDPVSALVALVQRWPGHL